MKSYKVIEQKINQYIRKYYLNELLKGFILCFSAIFIYFIITTLLEYLLWLNSLGRGILFWSFIIFTSIIIVKFIVIPVTKLFKWTKGIDYANASTQIGKHFPEVSDKLTNLLQLKSLRVEDELVIAGIEQKAQNLKPIPFQSAIQLSANVKYLKYAAIPIFLFLFLWIYKGSNFFSAPYQRVVNYQTYYQPPAPFSFSLLNTNLEVEEGQSINLQVTTQGSLIPENASILYNGKKSYLKPLSNGLFSYSIDKVTSNINFKFTANDVTSTEYQIEVIKVPKIIDFSMHLEYPKYTGIQNNSLKGQGNITIPEGTNVKWQLKTQSTNKVSMLVDTTPIFFEQYQNNFTLQKKLLKKLKYTITTSNQRLENHEKLSYQINVTKDQKPTIKVVQKKDSLNKDLSYFQINISDDYGLQNCRLVYFDKKDFQNKFIHKITTQKSTYHQFYYQFPNQNLKLKEGITYLYYFEVFDNDQVNGSKSTKSSIFSYRENTQNEKEEALLQNQNKSIDSIQASLQQLKNQKKELNKIEKTQIEKPKLSYSDKQKISKYIQRQKQQRQLMKQYMKSLKESLSQFQPKENTPEKEALQKRIENNEQKLQENEKLLQEIEKYQQKLDEEKLKVKIDKFSKASKQEERSLEQLLELTKRYYIEQKLQKIVKQLNTLAQQQKELSKITDKEEIDKQEKLNQQFNTIQNQLNQLQKENANLKQPLQIERNELIEKLTSQAQQKAKEDLEQSKNQQNNQKQQNLQQKANKQQQKAADNMKEMAKAMSQAMASMSSQQQQEDAAMLKQILDNLITFSKAQEALKDKFLSISNSHPNFSKHIRKQGQLRENFEHIDDSLFALALRNPMISNQITTKLTDIQYDINKTLERLTQNSIRQGNTSQQYVMANANELSNMLNAILEQMQMQMQGSGEGNSGQGKQGNSQGKGFQLSDIIQSHDQLKEQMQQKGQGKVPNNSGKGKQGDNIQEGNSKEKNQNTNKNNANGNPSGQSNTNPNKGSKQEKSKNGLSEEMSAEIFEIYKKQQQLRDQLENKIKELGLQSESKNLQKSLNQLEKDLLLQGFSSDVIKQMQNIKHQLLKIEKAAQQQGQENKRQATTNYKKYNNQPTEELDHQIKDYFQSIELLNRQKLPLQRQYKELIKQYFDELPN